MKKRRCPCCGRKGWKGTKEDYGVLKTILKYAVPIVERADATGDYRPHEFSPADRQELLAEGELVRAAYLKRLEKRRAYQRRYYAKGREKARLAREQRTNGGPNVH